MIPTRVEHLPDEDLAILLRAAEAGAFDRVYSPGWLDDPSSRSERFRLFDEISSGLVGKPVRFVRISDAFGPVRTQEQKILKAIVRSRNRAGL